MCALIALGSVSAEGDTYSEPEFGPVEFYDFDLEVEQEWKEVFLEWDAYEEDDFKWYKILRSEDNDNPVYPDDHVWHVFTDVESDEAWEKAKPGFFYYRVCVVTQKNARFCGDVVELEVDKEDIYSDEEEDEDDMQEKKAHKQHKKEKYQDRSDMAKEKIKKKYSEAKEQKHKKIASKIKNRLKNFVTGFEKKLNASSLSDADKSEKIEKIIEKLEDILEKKPKLAEIIDYLIDSLRELQAEYSDDLDEIEALFEL